MTIQFILEPMSKDDNPAPQFSEPIEAEIRRTKQAIRRYAFTTHECENSLAQFARDIDMVADLPEEPGKEAAPIIVCRAYQFLYRG